VVRKTAPAPQPAAPAPPPKKPLDPKSPEYQKSYNSLARRWLAGLIAAPVFFVTSYYLYDRRKCLLEPLGGSLLTDVPQSFLETSGKCSKRSRRWTSETLSPRQFNHGLDFKRQPPLKILNRVTTCYALLLVPGIDEFSCHLLVMEANSPQLTVI
jgi:hypothetical protein